MHLAMFHHQKTRFSLKWPHVQGLVHDLVHVLVRPPNEPGHRPDHGPGHRPPNGPTRLPFGHARKLIHLTIFNPHFIFKPYFIRILNQSIHT